MTLRINSFHFMYQRNADTFIRPTNFYRKMTNL